ncbi:MULTISPECIES: phosphonate ABC transporter, permease protein PhnE [Helcococcus]|uniref:Phosphonate ABC transporter, permease protein PhnE n=1 Tax=Helcococcus bovis TaxID=3153252 RepID=A0ABW9F7L6_9FIRM
MNEEILKKLEQEPNTRIKTIINIIIIIGLLVWSFLGLQSAGATKQSMGIVGNIFKGILSPDLNLINLTKQGIPYLLVETMAIAFLGTVLGAILAIPFSFLTSINIVPKYIAYTIRLFLILIRTIPALVYGLLFIRMVGPGPFAGVLTMAITSIGMISKLFAESIMDINENILESLSAMGLTTFQKIRYGIFPQLYAMFMSTIIYRFDINLRDATVLGLVGAGGIGAPLIFAINAYKWNQAGSILICLVALVLVIEFFSVRIRAKLIKGF